MLQCLTRPYHKAVLQSIANCCIKIRYLSAVAGGNENNDTTTVADGLVRMNKPKVRIDQIIKQKKQTVHTITDISTVEDAISHLVNHKVGSSLVTNINGDIAGIFTARDILSFINRKGSKKAISSQIKEFMTTKDKLVFCSPHDTARRAREMMFQLKIRNMPVIENGEVLGIVTIKDLADSAFSIEDTGGKKGFIENVIGRKGLPQGTKLKDKNNTTRTNNNQQKLLIEYSSYALTHPFKRKDGVAGRRRDYGADDLCEDLSLCEDAHFTLKVNTKHSESLSQVYLGIADGVGSWRQYGVDPKQFAHKLIDNAKQVIESDALQRDVLTGSGIGLGLLDQDPIHPVDIIMDAWNMTTYEKITGSSTISVAWIDRKYNQLSYSNVGDCGLMIVRHIDSETAGYMRERNVPRHLRKNDLRIAFLSQQQLKGFNLPYQLGYSGIKEHDGKFETPSDADSATLPIMAGDIIIMATDGLFDNLDLDEIINEVSDWELKYFTSTDDTLQSPKKNSQIAMDKLAKQLVIKAREMSLDPLRDSPFAVLAKDNDIMWGGGRPDDTTVIVARVFSDDNKKT